VLGDSFETSERLRWEFSFLKSVEMIILVIRIYNDLFLKKDTVNHLNPIFALIALNMGGEINTRQRSNFLNNCARSVSLAKILCRIGGTITTH